MIGVTLMGGMGNQMFQYSIGRSMAIENNIELGLDLSFLNRRDLGESFVYREYDLDIFNIDPKFISDNDILGYTRINEQAYRHSSEISDFVTKSKGSTIILNGYWQTPKYFENIESVIRNDFKFKERIEESKEQKILSMLTDILESNSVMVNVRRTDYLNTDYHGIMGNDYIQNARDIIEERVKNPRYFIFSDDIDWCRKNIDLSNSVIVDHDYKGYKFSSYLQLMKNCKNFIIPNSSFAWWAAWLNEDQNKIVIAPKKWFIDDSINTSDLIPEGWIRI